jgi:hypothetical protein
MRKKAGRKNIFAASAILWSSICWGQETLVADIPFQFRTPAGHSPAGHYEIVAGSGATRSVTTLHNLNTRKAVLTLPGVHLYSRKSALANSARLTFRCTASDCALIEIWPGGGNDGWLFIQAQEPAQRKIETARISVPAFASNKEKTDSEVILKQDVR